MASRLRKIRKQRGSRFHGWGQVKGHRSHPGGRGQAGLMKYKWTQTVKYDPDHFGKPKYITPGAIIVSRWLNVGELDSLADRVRNIEGTRGSSPKEQELSTSLDLSSLGVEKLLGSGHVKNVYRVIVSKFSSLAKEKVEKAGGEIVVE
jgi:large subunit ribosomal protein L15